VGLARALLGTVSIAFLVGFVPPKLHVEPEIVGVYDNEGTHPDGSSYHGVATIERLGASRYAITFETANGTFHAICVRDRDLLGCGWGTTGLGVALYRAKPDGLDGAWFREGDAALGREHIRGAGPNDDDAFDLDGTSPTGATYDGRIVSTTVGSIRRVTYRRGAETLWGWAIAQGSALVVGFPSASCGAALYRISADGRHLDATWMDFSRPDLGTSTETLVR
jgi:hypothetical protein